MKAFAWGVPAAVMGVWAVMAQTTDTGKLEILDTMQGSSFLAVQSALPVLSARAVDVAQCRIMVVRDQASAVAVFFDKSGRSAVMGVRQGQDQILSTGDLTALMTNLDRSKVQDTIQGTSVMPVRTAVAAIERYHADLAHYTIELARERNSLTVTFTDKEQQPDVIGNPGLRPGFEVEMNAADLRVVRSNLIR